MGFVQIQRVFWGDRGRWRTDSATNLRRKAFDSSKLLVYIWLLEPHSRSPLGLRRWTLLGDFCPPTPCATAYPDFRALLGRCLRVLGSAKISTNITKHRILHTNISYSLSICLRIMTDQMQDLENDETGHHRLPSSRIWPPPPKNCVYNVFIVVFCIVLWV